MRGGWWQNLRSVLGIGSPADWFFRQIAQSSALVVLLLVLSDRRAVVLAGVAGHSRSGRLDPGQPRLGSDARSLRRFVLRLWLHRYLADRHADRRAAGRGHGDVSGRSGAGLAAARRFLPGRVAGGDSQRGVRLLGHLLPGAQRAEALQPARRTERRRQGLVLGGPHSRHHDRALHRRRLLRRVPGRAARAARGCAGPGSDALANHLGRRSALRSAGHHRRLFPRPGPRHRRDDGRHHAHRQHAGHRDVAVRPRLHHPQPARPETALQQQSHGRFRPYRVEFAAVRPHCPDEQPGARADLACRPSDERRWRQRPRSACLSRSADDATPLAERAKTVPDSLLSSIIS